MGVGGDRKRVLIMDYDREIRRLLRLWLENEGLEVAEAEGGEQGLKLHREKPFDLVVADLYMPGGDGLAFLSAVQSAANVSGVSLSAWTPREKVPEKYYAKVPMKVELTGKFLQIARFFYNVGQLDRIINMENISMTDPKVVDNEIVLKTEALATAFHVVEESPDDASKKRPARGGK